jgi:hypothetical protein
MGTTVKLSAVSSGDEKSCRCGAYPLVLFSSDVAGETLREWQRAYGEDASLLEHNARRVQTQPTGGYEVMLWLSRL